MLIEKKVEDNTEAGTEDFQSIGHLLFYGIVGYIQFFGNLTVIQIGLSVKFKHLAHFRG